MAMAAVLAFEGARASFSTAKMFRGSTWERGDCADKFRECAAKQFDLLCTDRLGALCEDEVFLQPGS